MKLRIQTIDQGKIIETKDIHITKLSELSNLKGPGITGHIIYLLKKKGKAIIQTPDGRENKFTLMND